MNVRVFLETVRVFLTPTAPADSIAGFAVALALPGAVFEPGRLVGAAAASVLLYWFGMAANDLFDAPRDATIAPHKPLPSGRATQRQVAITAGLLAVGGGTLGTISGAMTPAIAVVVLAVLYDAGGKRIPVIGNLLMGGCRAANFLLGCVAAVGAEQVSAEPPLAAAALILGLFVAGITAVSVLEDRPFRAGRFHALTTPLLIIPLGLGATRPESTMGWVNTVLLLFLLLKAQRGAARARGGPVHPAAIYVRSALAGIYFVDAGLIWATARGGDAAAWPWAAALYGLAVVGWSWKRWWLQSGPQDT